MKTHTTFRHRQISCAFRNRLIWNFLWKVHYLYLSKMKQCIWNAFTVSCEVNTLFQSISRNVFYFRVWTQVVFWNESKTVSMWTQHMMTLSIAQVVKNRNIKGTRFNICCCNITLPLDLRVDTFFFVTKTYFLQRFQLSRQTNTYTLQIFFILSLLLKGIYTRIYFL